MAEIDFTRPIPYPTPVSRPFWAGLADGKVMLQRCGACERWVFYPRNRCPGCLSPDLDWHEVSGKGTLYTYTVTHQATSPHFAGDVPQVLAVVELALGVRLATTLPN